MVVPGEQKPRAVWNALGKDFRAFQIAPRAEYEDGHYIVTSLRGRPFPKQVQVLTHVGPIMCKLVELSTERTPESLYDKFGPKIFGL